MKQNPRNISLLLCAALLCGSLAGCSGNPGSSSPSSSAGSPSASAPASSAGNAPSSGEGPVKLTIFSQLNSKSANTVTSYEEVLSMQKLEEATGVDIEWQHPPIGQENEQFNLMCASQDLPDMIFWDWSAYPGGPEKAVLDNVIIKLNDLIETGAPNLQALFHQYPEMYRQAITDEKTLYTFPFACGACLEEETRIHNHFNGPAYRKDWADALNIPEPRTLDEWHDMLAAFKANFDCIPYSATATGGNALSKLAASFGVLEDFYMDGDRINHGLLSDGYKQWVQLMVDWYAEGLIDPDYMANDANSLKAKITNGEVGLYIGSMGGNWVSFCKVLEETVPEANLQYMHWPQGPDGVAYTATSTVNNICNGSGVSITTKCSNIDAAMRYLDYGYSDEGIALLNYGVEGVTYEIDANNEVVFTPELKKETDEKGTDYVLGEYAFGGISSWATLQAVPLIKLTRTYPGQYEMVNVWGDVSEALCMPPLTPTVEEATTMANIINQVTTYRNEMIGKIIMGQVPMSEYDAVVASAKAMGLEDAVAIQNAALTRFNNR